MRESTRYAAYISQSGLGMPDRDYYLKTDDAKLAEIRAKYEKHVEKMLALAGEKNAAAAAKAIVALRNRAGQGRSGPRSRTATRSSATTR